jgi:hypothetical protein
MEDVSLTRATGVAAALLAGGLALAAGCGADAPPPTGLAQEALTGLGSQQRVSQAGFPARDPSAAWIKADGLDNGMMLVGYTESGDVPAWSWSTDWTVTTIDATWNRRQSQSASPALAWPPPNNYCLALPDLCAAKEPWGGYDDLANIVWTGLDNLAAAVATGGPAGQPGAEVAVLTSTDAGRHFQKATIVSLASTDANSGGEIVAGTVYASLAYTPGRYDATMGTVAIPIYIVWQNFDQGKPAWWMTKVLVGLSGAVAQTTAPVRIKVIPAAAAAHVAVSAFFDDNDNEVVQLFWSERTRHGAPEPGPDCPSGALLDVKWHGTFTRDFGTNWACSGAPSPWTCDGMNTLIDEDTAWRPCVADSFGAQSPNVFNVNDDRPELVMNRVRLDGASSYQQFIAINKSASSGNMRVVVWRYDLIEGTTGIVFSSPGTAPDGTRAGDAWAQALTIAQNAGHKAALGITYRTSDPSQGLITQMGGSSRDDGLSWTAPRALSTGSNVPWKTGGDMGLTSGAAALQPCLGPGCQSTPATFPAIPMFAVWGDNRTQPSVPEAWGRELKP